MTENALFLCVELFGYIIYVLGVHIKETKAVNIKNVYFIKI